MGLAEKLELLVTLDPSQGVRGLDTIAKKAESAGTSVESSFSKIGASAMKLGVAGIAAGGFLTQMAAGDIEAANQLKSAVQSVGQDYDQFSDRIDEAAKAQVRFGHTDEEVNGALTTLTLSFNDTGKALDQMQLVADLAARKHISLADAASLVAKAHGGAGRVFKEFGIQVQANADGTKDYDGALTELSGKLTGQAAAAADTWTGKLAALRAEIQNQVSELAQEFAPAITVASAAVTLFGGVSSGVASIMGKVSAAHAAAAAAAQAQAAAELEVVVAERAVTANSAATVASLYAVDEASVASSAAFGLWGAAVAAGIIVASTAIDIWGGKTEHTFNEVAKFAAETGKELVMTFEDFKFEGNPEDAGKFLDALSAAGEVGIGTLKRLRDELIAEGKDHADVDAAIEAATVAQKNINDATAAGTTKVANYETALKALHDTIHGNLDPLFAMQKAIADNTTAQEAATKAQTDGSSSAADIAAANQKVAETALAVTDATNTLTTGMRDGTVSMSAAKDQLALWVEQGLMTQAQADKVAWSLGVVAGKANDLDGKNITMRLELETSAANAEFNAFANSHGGGTGVVRFAEGGPVDQVPKGHPMLAVVHGGEYVVTADEVDRAKRGGGMSHPGSSPIIFQGDLVLHGVQDVPAMRRAIEAEVQRA